MKKKSTQSNIFQKIIRIEYLALILSITAIWATYQQNITNEEFYHLSVKPLFKKGIVQSPAKITFTLYNYGLGIAIIDSIEMKYEGRLIEFNTMAKTIMSSYATERFSNSWGNDRDFVIKKDGMYDLFNIFYRGESKIEGWVSDEVLAKYDYQKINNMLHSIEATVYYRDLYGNKMVYSSVKGDLE